MERLLCIVGGMNAGGAETFLMKIYRSLDREKYQMDFYVATQEEGVYDQEILDMGGKIYRALPKSKGIFRSFIALKKTVKKERYKSVLRVSQHSLSALDLLASKIGGARVLAYRSSNTNTGGGNLEQTLHKLFLFLPKHIANVKLAPSSEAAEFMFGKGCVKNGQAVVLNNGIPLDVYAYSEEKRERIRKEFGLSNELLIGHVGRFNFQKNHEFLIDIFEEINKRLPQTKLMLVGKGELEETIKSKVNNLGLKDDVIFTGLRQDVGDILSAMDVFVFPSIFEGLPNTVIEAQGAGLPCVISDSISSEVDITPTIQFLSIRDVAEIWADSILRFQNIERNSQIELIRKRGYDIDLVKKIFIELLYK